MEDTGYPGSEQGRPVPSDQVQFGTSPRRPWLARLVIAAIGIAAITVAVVHSAAGAHRHHPPSAQRHHPTSARPSIAFTDTGHPILGEAAGWELFARGDTFVADIELGRGRVTRTAVPGLTSGNAASFVASAHEVIVRSYDSVPGYVIPDGKPAQVLTGPLATGGPLVAGPTTREVWTYIGTGSTLTLVTLSGRRVGPSIRFPPNGPEGLSVTADGRGYVLAMTTSGALVDLGPTWHRSVRLAVTAIGPTGWFGQQCGSRHSCRNVVMNPATGALRRVPGTAPAPAGRFPYLFSPPGVIAPDGGYAAVYQAQPKGVFRIVLIDLATGAQTRLHVESSTLAMDSMAWSPDCKWLFVASKGKLLAVSPASGKVTTLQLGLPPISQIAVRSAAP